MNTNKPARVRFPIHPLLANRWSPRAFAARAIDDAELGSLLEAARWAPSCFNAQPWRFVVARSADAEGYARLAGCLVEGNAWAKQAPLLLLSVARARFEHNDKPNRWAQHDVGLAMQSLVVQAEALGLVAHQMAGFDAAHARGVLGIPDGFDPVAMTAIGHPGDPAELSEELAARERAPRERKALEAIAFGARWDAALELDA